MFIVSSRNYWRVYFVKIIKIKKEKKKNVGTRKQIFDIGKRHKVSHGHSKKKFQDNSCLAGLENNQFKMEDEEKSVSGTVSAWKKNGIGSLPVQSIWAFWEEGHSSLRKSPLINQQQAERKCTHILMK